MEVHILRPLGRSRVRRGLLACGLALALMQSLAAAGAAAASSGPGGNPSGLTVGATLSVQGHSVNLAQLPAPPKGSTLSAHALPLLTRDAAALASAKSAVRTAVRSTSTGRPPVVSVGPATGSRASGGFQSAAPATGVSVSASFPAMSLNAQLSQFGNDQYWEPPDTQIAAGTVNGSVYGQVLTEVVNDSLSVWTTSGQRLAIADLNCFYAAAVPAAWGQSCDPAKQAIPWHITDPHVVYDSQSGRWFTSAFATDANSDSQVMLGVSKTSDPVLGGWWVYPVGHTTSGVTTDMPKLGLNSDMVVLAWNDYQGSSFIGSEIWVVNKADVVSGAATAHELGQTGLSDFNYVPAQELSGGDNGVEYIVVNNADPYLSGVNAAPAVGVVALTGQVLAGQTPNVTVGFQGELPIAATTVPPDAAQPNGGPPIMTNDDRFLFAVWQNGSLWTGGNDACLPPTGDGSVHSCLRLVQLSAPASLSIAPSVTQDFDVAAPSADLYYPAATFDGNGDMYLAYTESSSTMFPSVMASAQPQGLTGLEPQQTVQRGQAVYQWVYGNCGISPFFCADGYYDRWGDYSAAVPDPSNPAAAWVGGEYALSAPTTQILPYDSAWGTAAGQLTLRSSSAVAAHMSLSAPQSAAAGQSVPIVGSVTDAAGLPVQGAQVQLQSTGGSFSSANPVTTGATGGFSATFVAPDTGGPVAITASVLGANPAITASATLSVTATGAAGAGSGHPLWTAQNSVGDLSAVSFADAIHGWAAGTGGRLLASIDGGADWSPVTFSNGTGEVSLSQNLNAVSAVSPNDAWAVGAGDTVVSSVYSGQVWAQVYAPPDGGTLNAVTFAGPSDGWVAGTDTSGDGAIWATTDGGASWVRQTTGSLGTLPPINGLAFLDGGQQGWAVGANGTILQYAGGAWTAVSSGTSYDLSAVSAVDATHAWAVGAQGTVLFWNGTSWNAVGGSPGTGVTLSSVDFLDGQNGWLAGTDNSGDILIWSSSDSGQNWTSQFAYPASGTLALTFTDPTHGWAVGNDGVLAYKPGPWMSLGSLQGDPNQHFSDVSFADAQHGWAVGHGAGGGALIESTSDGGQSWTVQNSVYAGGNPVTVDQALNAVTFADAQHGWAVGNDGTILGTSDGGQRWTVENTVYYGDNLVVPSVALNAISCVDNLHCWIVGDALGSAPIGGLTILATTDGGQTWTFQEPLALVPGLLGTDLRGVSFVNDNGAYHGWAVGQNGVIFATDDGGLDWAQQKDPAIGSLVSTLNAVHFVDAQHGWVVGSSVDLTSVGNLFCLLSGYGSCSLPPVQVPLGVIASTSDGGLTWSVQANGNLASIPALGEPGGAAGSILLSLSRVHFTDALHGWAIGSDEGIVDGVPEGLGAIYTTSDGGRTWAPQVMGVTDALSGLSSPDPAHAWAIGENGSLLAFTSAAGQAAGLTLSAATTDVASGGSVTLSGEVVDGNNQPVANATVDLSAKLGTVPATAQTGSDGTFTVTYTAPTGVAASETDTVTATLGTLSATAGLTILPFQLQIGGLQVEDAGHNPLPANAALTEGQTYYLSMTLQNGTSTAMNPLYLIEALQHGTNLVLSLGSVQTSLAANGSATATVSFTPQVTGSVDLVFLAWSNWLNQGGVPLAGAGTLSVQVQP